MKRVTPPVRRSYERAAEPVKFHDMVSALGDMVVQRMILQIWVDEEMEFLRVKV